MADWASLPLGVLDVISNKLLHPEDFAFFRCVCSSWREVHRVAGFAPWIIKSPFMYEEGMVEVHRLGDEAISDLHHPGLLGGHWEIIGASNRLLIAIERGSQIKGRVVNPVTGWFSDLPSLPSEVFCTTLKGFIIRRNGRIYVIVVPTMPCYHLMMTKGVRVFLLGGLMCWIQISSSKFWWRISDFLDGIASENPFGAIMDLDESTPEFELWQPGMGEAQLILDESREFFLKSWGIQTSDPAEHEAQTPMYVHAFNDDIWMPLEWEAIPWLKEKTVLLGWTSEVISPIPGVAAPGRTLGFCRMCIDYDQDKYSVVDISHSDAVSRTIKVLLGNFKWRSCRWISPKLSP